MTLKRKLGIAAVLVVVVLAVGLCWPRPKGYTYQGKTVEEWFEEVMKQPTLWGEPPSAADKAFPAMGTNAAPFLVARLAVRFSFSERLASRFTSSIEKRKYKARNAAGILLHVRLRVPSDMFDALCRSNGIPVIVEHGF